VQAARAAERAYAFDETRRYARRALELWSSVDQPEVLVPVDRIGLLDRCAYASALLGDYAPAIRDAREALAGAEAAGDDHRADLLHDRLRWILWESGDRRAALAEVEAALHRLAGDPSRATALAHLAGMRMFAGQLVEARAAAEEALALARGSQTPADEAISLAVLGWIRALSGEVDGGLADFRAAIAIAEAVESIEGLGLGHTNLVALLDRIGRPSEALAAAEQGLALVRRLGMERTYGGQLRGSAAKALFALGRWDEAEAITDEGLRLEPAGPAAIWLHVQRARIDAARGHSADAERHLDAARRIDDALGRTEYRSSLLAAVAERAVWDGRADDARAAAAEGLRLMVEDAVPDPGLAWLAALELRAMADAAERARLRRDAAAVADAVAGARAIAARLPAPDAPPNAAWGDRGVAILALCSAELARLDGPDGADPVAWSEAAHAWDAVERPFPAAYCRFRQAEAILAIRGDREAARAALADAHATAARLGAGPLLAETEVLARHARLDLAAAGPSGTTAVSTARPAAAAGSESLDALGFTPRELEVLRLVAGGWTNQQIADVLFITRKTASVHVSNILAKLGVSGRGEAGAIAHRLGLGKDAPPPPGSDPLA
jgi:DNA-binding CsgD family transcriptional regulator/tetratricopeptide (TPR) repeat protein